MSCLPRVGVPHQRHFVCVAAPLALHLPTLGHLGEAVLEQLDAVPHEPTIGFELRLTGATHADAAAELLEVGPHAREARQRVFELGELHLHARLGAARPHREDVQNEFGAVDHALAHLLLEVLALRGGKLVVEDHDGRAGVRDERLELIQLAAADVGGGVGLVELLRQFADDARAGVDDVSA